MKMSSLVDAARHGLLTALIPFSFGLALAIFSNSLNLA